LAMISQYFTADASPTIQDRLRCGSTTADSSCGELARFEPCAHFCKALESASIAFVDAPFPPPAAATNVISLWVILAKMLPRRMLTDFWLKLVTARSGLRPEEKWPAATKVAPTP